MKLLLQHDGKVYDYSQAIVKASLVSSWMNGASKFTFSFDGSNGSLVGNGDYLEFEYEGQKLFAGVVFKFKKDETSIVEVTAYDQLRYLKAKDTVMRKNMNLGEFVKVCTENVLLVTGDLNDTQVKLGDYLFDNQTYLDMIYQSITDTLLLSAYYYVLRDVAGVIELKELYDLRLPLILGDKSLVHKIEIERSIDTDTFNQVKLAKDNEESGLRDIYLAKDSSSIDKIGLLQHFEKVDGNMNDAQIEERAQQLLKLKNRETEKIKISAIGDVRVLGGSGIRIILSSFGIDQWGVVESVTHNFSPVHEMELNLLFTKE